ncbi:hypothetical protein JR316_0004319 [Psilocybe cubensis]|uniref:Uncharacterized protein n=1 Tax=Psilocybe cubensis TaxID=181762 RepID=A0ACB8H3I1_PSICU|nr:hypothetical protein JR316_0004319 [Psilocybe cubensis]KAH9482222.1 hypothetical protein JR316_0004319 [Psilocybe cubensis]
MGHQVDDGTYDALGQLLKGKYLVGMMPERFLEEFLSWNADTPLNYKEQQPSANRVQCIISESSTHQQNTEGRTDTKQQLRFGHFTRPDDACGSMNVEISTYWEEDFPSIASGSCNFALHQTHGVFKSDISHDAFAHPFDEGTMAAEDSEFVVRKIEIFSSGESNETHDASIYGNVVSAKEKKDEQISQEDAVLDGSPVVKLKNDLSNSISNIEIDTEPAIRTRGQIAAYAGATMSMAFRTHFFSMMILGHYARFIHWDRSGAVVTSRFDYTKNPYIIFEFYLRYGQLTPRQRGFDTNVQPIKDGLPPHVANAFNKYHRKSWYEGAKFEHKTHPSNHIPISQTQFFRIKIEDRTQGRVETFIIPPPIYKKSSLMPFGRASRRSLAYLDDAVAPKMCFFKDSWHDISERSAPEADIYRLLQSKNVPNIASMRLGDDVEGSETKTQRWVSAFARSGQHKRIGTMVCHRLIMDTVARDLSTFTWCKVLLKCLADAVDAAQEAYKVGVLHRDISAGNIMITMDDKTHELRGILIDWDMCLLHNQRNSNINRKARTGTWAFMSARLLSSTNASKPVIHSLSDDMESFFWVLFYQVLLYTRHSKSGEELEQLLQSLFDDAAKGDNGMVGGQVKMWALQIACNPSSIRRFTKFDRVELEKVLHELGYLFNSPYVLSEQEDEERKAQNSKVKVVETEVSKPAFSDDEDDPDDDDDDDAEDDEDSNKDDEDDNDNESEEESDDPDEENLSLQGHVGNPSPIRKDLNDPNEKLLSDYLRQIAHSMEPWGVTPAGLLSPKQNSRPPKNPARWRRALPKHHEADFYPMRLATDANVKSG